MRKTVTAIVHNRAPRRRPEKVAAVQPIAARIVGPALQSLDPDPETLRRADLAQGVWEELVRRVTEAR